LKRGAFKEMGRFESQQWGELNSLHLFGIRIVHVYENISINIVSNGVLSKNEEDFK
jgi:hypothetical protein